MSQKEFNKMWIKSYWRTSLKWTVISFILSATVFGVCWIYQKSTDKKTEEEN